jgi:hypothetical protein
MMDFMFFVKTFIFTVAIVLVLQIQVGEGTLETHALGWVQSSSVTQPLNYVARGAAKLTNDVTQKIWNSVHHNVKDGNKKEENRKGSSSFFWQHSFHEAAKSKQDE